MPATLIDQMVDQTPDHRDRYVDLLRALSIAVVIMWHWVFSVTHWNRHGALTMPNPIDSVPLLWLGTWFLQIMPVFFFVGGYSNLAALDGSRRKGESVGTFYQRRLKRLLTPIAVFLALWTVGDVLARLADPSYPGVLHWGVVVFVPLWFIGMYTAVILLSPLTARCHQWNPAASIVGLAGAIAAVDFARFGLGQEQLGLANSLLVFVFAHQLGYFWRDGTLVNCARRRLWGLMGLGLGLLVAMTTWGIYPHSMVSVPSDALSNMFPTTAAIAALAIFQVGLVMLLRPAAERLLARRKVWKTVVATNGVAMTLFTWHMTALVAAIGVAQLAGHRLGSHPTANWWAGRPLWLLLPGVILAGLVAVFARFELPKATKLQPVTAEARR